MSTFEPSVSPTVAKHRAKVQEKLRAAKTTRFSDPLLRRYFNSEGRRLLVEQKVENPKPSYSSNSSTSPPKPRKPDGLRISTQVEQETSCCTNEDAKSVASGASFMSAGFFTAVSKTGDLKESTKSVQANKSSYHRSNSTSFKEPKDDTVDEPPSKYSIDDNEDSFTVKTKFSKKSKSRKHKKTADYNGDIVKAAANGNVKAVHKLLKQAMIAAATNGQENVVERLLLDQGIHSPWDAVNASAAGGHHGVLNLFLNDRRINFKSSNCKALRVAAANSQLVVVKQLLEDRRNNPAVKENKAIRVAAELGNLAVVDRLMDDRRVDPSAKDNQALRYASKNGHLEVVELLLKDRRCDPGVRDSECLQSAAANSHLNVVERLLRDKRCDPACNGNYCLRTACKEGTHEIVDKLLRTRKVDPSLAECEALHIAVERGHHEVVRRLLKDKRTDPSSRGNSAIVTASSQGWAEVVRLLLEDARVDPSIQGNKAVKAAAERNHGAVVRLLLNDTRVDERAISSFALAWNVPKAGTRDTNGGRDVRTSSHLFQPKKLFPRLHKASSSFSISARAASASETVPIYRNRRNSG